MKQHSSLANPTVVTKLEFIWIKTELVYIGRRRTTSVTKNNTRVNKKFNDWFTLIVECRLYPFCLCVCLSVLLLRMFV